MLSKTKTDEYYMNCALELAENGRSCSPNPKVGCVIVRDGKIIGSGWHDKCGEPHAEANAVADAGGDIKGAAVYVTLEPCSHFGRQPPCAELLVRHAPARVIAATGDPNPKVAGRGFARLRDAGIEVKVGVLEKEARYINRGFLRRIKDGRPWVTVKCAASLDGKVALENGESKWITGPEARAAVHAMRAANDALATGSGTILADDPELTVRDAPGRTPLRAVFDRRLRTPAEAKLLNTPGVLVFTAEEVKSAAAQRLIAAGAEVECLDAGDSFIKEALARLAEKGVNYLMLEAGPELTSAFMAQGLCDELVLFMAPKLMGRGRSFTDGLIYNKMSLVQSLKNITISSCGCDLMIKGSFECSQDL